MNETGQGALPSRSGPDAASPATKLAPALGRMLRDHAWLIGLCLLQFLLVFAIARLYGRPFSIGLYSELHLAILLAFVVFFLAYRIVRTLIVERPDRPFAAVRHDLLETCRLPIRVLNALPPLVLLPMALSANTSMKALIPAIQPYDWDTAFASLDAALHAGLQPWEILHPILGDPAVTRIIDFLYGPPWFWMLITLQFWLVFTLDPRRMQGLFTFILCWLLLGNVMATALSSAGPVYYGLLVDGPDPFAGLKEYLEATGQSQDLFATRAQEYLWIRYLDGYLTKGNGISAMPSLHIAMGFLFVLVCWPIHWILRAISLGYLAVLLIGSVHLGWHYAVDGYIAILGTWLIWWTVGWTLARGANRQAHADT